MDRQRLSVVERQQARAVADLRSVPEEVRPGRGWLRRSLPDYSLLDTSDQTVGGPPG